MIKKFARKDLQDLVYGDSETLTTVEDNVVDSTRWSVCHDLIFKDKETEKFYQTGYSVGATESQMEEPFEYEEYEIECCEVKQEEKICVVWVQKLD